MRVAERHQGNTVSRQRAKLESYVKNNGIKWAQFHDSKNEIGSQYRVRLIPTTYLIDKKGKIRYKSLRGAQLEVAVEKLINE